MAAPETFARRTDRALGQPLLRQALAGVERDMPRLRSDALALLPDYPELRARAAAIRAHALANLADLLEAFEARVRSAGGQVHWARDAAEARGIIAGLCRDAGARRVTKSKSMVTEEIDLNAHLEAQGCVVTETDLGEYIIQLRGERPSHILAPALHVSLPEVGAAFEAHHAIARPAPLSSAESMLAEARAVLRERFLGADVGITGANFLVAETGSVVLVTNEGNADLTAGLPDTHIVVTGIEKVVADLDDVATLLRVLARSAIGEPLSNYTTFIQGPRAPGEASGPRHFHVVLVDNGRSRALAGPRRDILRCIRCSACLNHCPVYATIGGHAYGSVYSGPMGAVLGPALGGLKGAVDLPRASTLCGRCATVCPVEIPLIDLLRDLRREARERGLGPAPERLILQAWRRAGRPGLAYRVTTSLLAWLLHLLSVPDDRGVRRWVRRLMGPGRGWTRFRDLPAPAGRTFASAWRRRLRAEGRE